MENIKIGDKFKIKHCKNPYIVEIADIYTTTNSKNEVIRTEYKVKSIISGIESNGLLPTASIARATKI